MNIELLPGSQPGKIRIRGDAHLAEEWRPRILADREKIRAAVQKGDELVALVLAVAAAYQCPPDEISTLLNLAARDPVGMRRSFEIMAEQKGLRVGG